MAHEIAKTSTGRNAIAFTGETPWHGLGQQLTPNQPLEVWAEEAGLDWEAKRAPVLFDCQRMDLRTGNDVSTLTKKSDSVVLYRSDTGLPLSIVSNRYQAVQPREVIEFYRDLTEKYGFALECAGVLMDGKKIWALANTHEAFNLRGEDKVKGYLLLATSYDGSMATQARFTSVRVVCNNTLEYAGSMGRADVTVRHSTTFNADDVKASLNVGAQFREFNDLADAMSKRFVDRNEQVQFFLQTYFDLKDKQEVQEFVKDDKNEKTVDKVMTRLATILVNAPGAHMQSANGMLWGLLNAVTFEVDHAAPSHSNQNRLNKAWFGAGATRKERALALATAML